MLSLWLIVPFFPSLFHFIWQHDGSTPLHVLNCSKFHRKNPRKFSSDCVLFGVLCDGPVSWSLLESEHLCFINIVSKRVEEEIYDGRPSRKIWSSWTDIEIIFVFCVLHNSMCIAHDLLERKKIDIDQIRKKWTLLQILSNTNPKLISSPFAESFTSLAAKHANTELTELFILHQFHPVQLERTFANICHSK